MQDNERIVQAIYRAVDELNKQLPKGVHVGKSADSPLYGKSGKLESIDLVTLMIEVEEKIKEEFGIPITVADERAMSQEDSPFLSIGSLTDYIAELLKENGNNA
jgi:acyl carrier protein